MLQDGIQVHLKASQGPIAVLTCELGPGPVPESTACFLALEESRIQTEIQSAGLELQRLAALANVCDVVRIRLEPSRQQMKRLWKSGRGLQDFINVFVRFWEFRAGLQASRPPGGAARPSAAPQRWTAGRRDGAIRTRPIL